MRSMPIGLLKDIAAHCPQEARILGLDVGAKTLGMAVSDPVIGVATPVGTIKRVKFTKDILQIAAVIKDYEVGGFVLGFPLNMDGSEGPRCQSIRDFALNMKAHPEIFGADPWIALWDERLSTASVEGFVDETVGIRRRSAKDKGITDKLAAQHILQGALDYIDRLG